MRNKRKIKLSAEIKEIFNFSDISIAKRYIGA